MRSRRDDLSTNQAAAASMNLREIGGCYVPLLTSWCDELLPEIADEEEVCLVCHMCLCVLLFVCEPLVMFSREEYNRPARLTAGRF